MTFECIETIENRTATIICEETSPAMPTLKQKVQPWLKLIIAGGCMTQAPRFLGASDPIGILVGLALLMPIPSCCYLGWRDYQFLQQARTPRVASPAWQSLAEAR